ncbi:MAG: hypothetical protein P4L33_00545 [Capsulimonadaceae bacterium]|nr:hypothetical protein [Capsulimonadaceae bacterium]
MNITRCTTLSVVLGSALAIAPCHAQTGLSETLIGQTSKPNISVYVPADTVPIQFTVNGIPQGQPDQTLRIKVVDEHAAPIAEKTIPVSCAGASWTTTYLAPSSKLGFYRVFAALSNGVTLPKMGSRQAGYLTYCVVPDPAGRTAYPPSEARFGMQGGFNGSLNLAPYLGFNWVNGPGRWDSNEPDHPGQFVQKRDAEKASGRWGPSKIPGATRGYEWCCVQRDGNKIAWPIYPVFALNSPPNWAYLPGKLVGSTAPLKPDAYDAWAAYCKAFATSVAEDYPNLDEHFYQVTWEPNWFNGTDQQFVDIYALAYKALHAGDSKAIVAGPTKSGVGDFNMANEVTYFKLGFGSYIDAYTIHPYIDMPSEQNGFLDKLAKLVAFPSVHAGRSIPVYSTEQGDATGEDPGKEIDQARHLIRSNLITLGQGVRFYFAFFIHDYKGEPGFGYFYNLRDDEKFGSGELAPKPIVPAFAAETYLLDGHATVGPLDYLGDTALGYAFQRKDDVVLALWDYGKSPRTVTLATGAKSVKLYDWMGNAKTCATPDGQISVTLTQEPIYVRGVSPAIWGAGASRTLDLASTSITTMPGGKIVIPARLLASAKPLAGTFTVSANPALGTRTIKVPVALKTGELRTVPVKLNVPTTTQEGTYVVALSIADASRRVRIDVKPPVKIASITPSIIDIVPGTDMLSLKSVKITLSSIQAETVDGKLSLEVEGIPGGASMASFDVEPNCDPVIALPCKALLVEPAKTYRATLTGTTSSGLRFSQRLTLSLLSAAHLAGQEPAGASAPTVMPCNWTPAAMAKARVHVGWSDHGLAITAEVPDSSANSAEANLRVAVNLDPDKVERSTGDVYNDLLAKRRFSVLSFSLVDNVPQVKRIYSFNGDKLHCGKLYDWQLPAKIAHIGTTTTYSLTIPWKELSSPSTPAPGTVIGLAVAANAPASDAPHPPAYTLFGGVWPKPDSDALGDVVLAE